MKHQNHLKKAFAIAVIILLFGLSIVPSTTSDMVIEQSPLSSLNSKTLYVGGSGEGNYTSIQDAIDDAGDRDTVYVYNGTYYENVIVNKSISLIGENTDSSIIDGNQTGEVVHISAHRVNVSGFTLQNSSDEGYDAGIGLYSNNNIITGNNIINNNEGMVLHWGSSHLNMITDNVIRDNEKDGLYLRNSRYNEIHGNTISNNNYFGLILYDHSDNNIISGNYIFWSGIDGLSLQTGCFNNIILNNTVESSYFSGVSFDVGNKNNTIKENSLIGNRKGVDCYISDNNFIIGNNISRGMLGIIIGDSSDNIISRNMILRNGKGIEISRDSSNNEMKENIFLSNGHGVHLLEDSSNNFIYNNNFIDNSISGYDGLRLSNKWDWNYWDDWIGLRFRILRLIPYRISGKLFSFNFDRHPAQEPYDI